MKTVAFAVLVAVEVFLRRSRWWDLRARRRRRGREGRVEEPPPDLQWFLDLDPAPTAPAFTDDQVRSLLLFETEVGQAVLLYGRVVGERTWRRVGWNETPRVYDHLAIGVDIPTACAGACADLSSFRHRVKSYVRRLGPVRLTEAVSPEAVTGLVNHLPSARRSRWKRRWFPAARAWRS
jgi:hypothetical protein